MVARWRRATGRKVTESKKQNRFKINSVAGLSLTEAYSVDDIVFFYLYENVENIIRTRKELMRNLVEFMDEPKRVPPEVRDELGIQLPDSESESPADSDSDSGDY